MGRVGHKNKEKEERWGDKRERRARIQLAVKAICVRPLRDSPPQFFRSTGRFGHFFAFGALRSLDFGGISPTAVTTSSQFPHSTVTASP